jgi:hypothetical protein
MKKNKRIKWEKEKTIKNIKFVHLMGRKGS